MALSSMDLVEKVQQAAEAIDGWPGGEDAAHHAETTAALLHSLWPGTALAACVLQVEGKAWASVRDEKGGRRPEWEHALRDEGLRPLAERSTAPTALGLTGQALAWGDVRFRARVHGALALASSEGDRAGQEAAGAFLAAVGRLLAARLEVEALERERGALKEEAAGDARMADFGEAAAMMGHEFNNFLNALLLHIAVMELKLPTEFHPGLKEVRRQALDAAALIHLFQNYRRRGQNVQETTDLNRAVRAAASELTGASIQLDLADGARMLASSMGDLKRLCRILLRNAAGAAATTGGGVVAHTSQSGDRIVLRIEDEGPALAPDEAARLFEPSAPSRDGVNSLEMAACRTIARRMQGVVRAEPRPEGGAVVVVEWPQKPEV